MPPVSSAKVVVRVSSKLPSARAHHDVLSNPRSSSSNSWWSHKGHSHSSYLIARKKPVARAAPSFETWEFDRASATLWGRVARTNQALPGVLAWGYGRSAQPHQRLSRSST